MPNSEMVIGSGTGTLIVAVSGAVTDRLSIQKVAARLPVQLYNRA